MLGLEFTKFLAITKKDLELGKITYQENINYFDFDQSLETIRLLRELTNAILEDKRVQEIIEKRPDIFTTITKLSFGILS